MILLMMAPSRHPVDSCLKKVSIILANSQAELVGSFVLNHQEFLYSSIADTSDSSKKWDMSHFFKQDLRQKK